MRRLLPPPIPLEEAERLLAAQVPPPSVESVELESALGAVLAEPVDLDSDFPPFNRAMMDGFAVVAADTAAAPVELDVIEEIPAGSVPRRRVDRGRCAKIMTGAPVPEGADAVQPVERTEPAGARVRILEPVSPGQNVAPRGSDAARGTRVLDAGRFIRPAELAVLAAAGQAQVRVFRRPRCAVASTGDELVDPSRTPGPGRIRDTNGFSVPAQVRRMGLTCDVLPRAPDRPEEIRQRVRRGLERDALILCGGVSAGDRDLVVPSLEAEGVTPVFHQVLIRPGRPFYFGRRESHVVFGLPGNPVSAFVTFELLVRPFLGRMMGRPEPSRPRVRARLAEPLPKRAERLVLHPSRVESTAEGWLAHPLPWRGSADIFTLARANALTIQPINTPLDAGASVDVIFLDVEWA